MALAPAFVGALAPEARRRLGDAGGLEERLRGIVERCGEQLRDAELTPETLVEELARRVPADTDPARAVELLHAEELILALACARGNKDAIARLERLYGDAIAASFARVKLPPSVSADDLKQMLREKLFVGVGRPPRICQYSAHSSLSAWLRVAAHRIALDATRRLQVDADAVEHELALAEGMMGFELGPWSAEYRDAFREAFSAAVNSLPARDKTLLRQAVVHGMSVRQLGKMYGVHAATAARWLHTARETVVATTREHAAALLGIDAAELDSMVELLVSGLDISIVRILR